MEREPVAASSNRSRRMRCNDDVFANSWKRVMVFRGKTVGIKRDIATASDTGKYYIRFLGVVNVGEMHHQLLQAVKHEIARAERKTAAYNALKALSMVGTYLGVSVGLTVAAFLFGMVSPWLSAIFGFFMVVAWVCGFGLSLSPVRNAGA